MRKDNTPVFLPPSKSVFWIDFLAAVVTFFALFPELFSNESISDDTTSTLLLSLAIIVDTYVLLTFQRRRNTYLTDYNRYLIDSGEVVEEGFQPPGIEYAGRDGNTYNLRSDGHRGKHFAGSKRLSKIIKNKKSVRNKVKSEFGEKNDIATFFLCMVSRYEPLLVAIIKLYADQNQKPPPTHFRLLYNVGVDQGELTDVVELYYNRDTGSHIRPKFFTSRDRSEPVVETGWSIQSIV